MRRSTWIIAVVTWTFHLALYMAYVVNLGWREWIAGVLAAGIATFGAVVFAVQSKVVFRFRWHDLLQAYRLPWRVLSGTAEAMAALCRQLYTRQGAASFLAAVPFEMGEEGDPTEAGRRALAITYTTCTPNSVALGLVREQKLFLYHQVLPTEVPAITQQLGARP